MPCRPCSHSPCWLMKKRSVARHHGMWRRKRRGCPALDAGGLGAVNLTAGLAAAASSSSVQEPISWKVSPRAGACTYNDATNWNRNMSASHPSNDDLFTQEHEIWHRDPRAAFDG